MTGRIALAALALWAVLAVPAAPARADVAIEGAGVFGGGAASSAGAALSLGLLHVPLTPFSADLTVAVPFSGGFATTLDGRLEVAGTTIGAGAGFGRLGAGGRTGGMYDALIARGIAPHTALQIRVYVGGARSATSFAGIRFSF